MIDCCVLINLVRAKRGLWDRKMPEYHLRTTPDQLWSEISDEMNEPAGDLKRRWKGLRDTYRRELKKVMDSKAERGSGWHFFEQMDFLSDAIGVKSRKEQNHIDDNSEGLQGNDSQTEDSCSEIENAPETEDVKLNIIEYGICSASSASTNEPQTFSPALRLQKPLKNQTVPNKRPRRDRYDQPASECENNMLPADDSDYHFLMSLVPYLQDVPRDKKLRVRMDIMNIIAKAQGT